MIEARHALFASLTKELTPAEIEAYDELSMLVMKWRLRQLKARRLSPPRPEPVQQSATPFRWRP